MNARSTFAAAAILVALVGLAASIHAYLTPRTGVEDTAGPILTGLGHAGMAVAALLVLALSRGLGLWVTLFVIAAVLTAIAAFLLQQPMILLPALLALVILPLGLLVGGAR